MSEYTAPLWEAARGDYDRRMSPIEDKMSEKLREHFGARLIPSLQASMRSRVTIPLWRWLNRASSERGGEVRRAPATAGSGAVADIRAQPPRG